MKRGLQILLVLAWLCAAPALAERTNTAVAVIGTGDMGNSIGPRLADNGFRVI